MNRMKSDCVYGRRADADRFVACFGARARERVFSTAAKSGGGDQARGGWKMDEANRVGDPSAEGGSWSMSGEPDWPQETSTIAFTTGTELVGAGGIGDGAW